MRRFAWVFMLLNLAYWVAFGSVTNLAVGLYMVGRVFELRESCYEP